MSVFASECVCVCQSLCVHVCQRHIQSMLIARVICTVRAVEVNQIMMGPQRQAPYLYKFVSFQRWQ